MKKLYTATNLILIILVLSPILSLKANDVVTHKDSVKLRLEVEGVYAYGDGALIRLVEKGKDKYAMAMVIGGCEANAIVRTTEGVDFSRPLTYDLFDNIFEQTSLEIKFIYISKLEDGVFYAELHVKDGNKTVIIDARPSDSMNIALKIGVPIYCAKKVWEETKEELE